MRVSRAVLSSTPVLTVTSTSALPRVSILTGVIIEKVKIKSVDRVTVHGDVITSPLKLTVVSEVKLVSLPAINKKRGSGIKWEQKAESGMSVMLSGADGGRHVSFSSSHTSPDAHGVSPV